MDPVGLFVAHARKVVEHLDYVATCLPICGDPPEAADALVIGLAATSLRRSFYELLPALAKRGSSGALPTSFAQRVWIDTERAVDGIRIARDWRAWLAARAHVVEVLDALERHVEPTPASPSESTTPVPSASTPSPPPAPPGEARPAGNSTPSVHDIAGTLTDNTRCVLQALYEAKATCRADAMTKVDIGSAAGVEGKSLRRALEPLRDTVPPCIFSAPGAAGGVWLSSLGVDVALAIMEPSATSEAGTKGARKGHELGAKGARTGRR